jgi:esterase/lipase superfamily enzyme
MSAQAKLLSSVVLALSLCALEAAQAQNCHGVDPTANRPLQAVTLPPAASNKCTMKRSSDGYPLPDPKCTPGAFNPTVTFETLRDPHFRRSCAVNHALSDAQRAQVYSWYGIVPPQNNSGTEQTCALDYLVPLEIGGADSLENIWPLCGPAGATLAKRYFRQKLVVDRYVLAKVKAGDMTLTDAQAGMGSDWTDYANGVIRPPPRRHYRWRFRHHRIALEKTPTVLRLLIASTRAKLQSQVSSNGLEPLNLSDEPAVPPALTFGAALVSVPPTHNAGQVERPFCLCLFGFTLYKESEDENKHIVLKSTVWLSQDDFLNEVNSNSNHQVIVFVHGFNTSLEDGLFRLAQIVFDSHFIGSAILFSWPSAGGIMNYEHDADTQQASWDGFRQLIKLLQNDPQISAIHVIAHSMGNRIVLAALATNPLENDLAANPLKKGSGSLGELILAAPDVDRKNFMIDEPKIMGFRGVTLYASSEDWALKASEKLHGNFERAGDVPPPPMGPIVLPHMDTIDASVLGTDLVGLNHNTFAASSALCDIGRLLDSGTEPPQRRTGVIEAVAGPPAFWRYARQDPNWSQKHGCMK